MWNRCAVPSCSGEQPEADVRLRTTGILSMFAAKSGAKKVYAVDASAVAFKAERNIKNNGLGDVITYAFLELVCLLSAETILQGYQGKG